MKQKRGIWDKPKNKRWLFLREKYPEKYMGYTLMHRQINGKKFYNDELKSLFQWPYILKKFLKVDWFGQYMPGESKIRWLEK